MSKLPATQRVNSCYHCDKKNLSIRLCEIWEVWSCEDCLASHHAAHHTTCQKSIPRERFAPRPQRYFVVWLTRYDGRPCSLTCKLGAKLVMEDHWMGTYIFASSGMILVLEDRATINLRILEGLSASK